ncbi:O-antigen ligase family protein [Alphaproteobacteria bacterium]|nr:O-antigen ligase family protein [Alphaproteobacteria bacterium]MDB2575085.1 O-antigen ligase family protein [Alphaproteobacteria bacterium]MDB2656011.1 O-antigen ligase family protein [Alphaproteobacteria bacterium]
MEGKKNSLNLTEVSKVSLRLSLFCFGLVSLYFQVSGFRLYLYEIVGAISISILIYLFFRANLQSRARFSEVKIVVALLTLLLLVDIISSIGALTVGNNEIFGQHLKGIFKSFFLTTFLITFLIFNAITDFKYSVEFLNVLCFVIFLSCIYQFLYLLFFLIIDVNIDDIVWPILSLGGYTPEDNNTLGDTAFSFARHGGFSKNANMLVTQILSALPYVLLMSLMVSKRYIFLTVIFTVALLLTISRSGILGLATIILFIPFINISVVPRLMAYIASVTLVFVALDLFYNLGMVHGVFNLFIDRSAGRPYFESARWSLVLAGFDMYQKSPIFGLGLNASPVFLKGYPISAITGPDLHNYWVQLFVERGVFAIIRVFFYGYILLQCLRLRNIHGQALAVSLVCLLVNSLTNNGLAHPFIQIYVSCAYCCCLYENRFSKDDNK